MGTDDRSRAVYEVAQTIAPGWERQRARIETIVAPVRAWMLGELAPEPGDTVLELAAGIGDTGYEAAALVGKRGRVLSTDFSPEMVDAARRRGAELELRNIDHRVLDAEAIELEADSVDGVLCRFGYMLMADPAAALVETRRVLRPGGRVALSVWATPDLNPWVVILAGSLVEAGHLPPPDPNAPAPFSLGTEEGLRELLERTGWTAVRIEALPVRFGFADVDDYLGFATDTAGEMAVVLRGLSDAERDELGARLEAAFTPFAAERGYELPGVALAASAS